MAVAVDGVSSGSANSSSLSWSHTLGTSGNLLLVGLCLDSGITASGGVTYGATSMTLLRRDSNSGDATSEIWYLDNITTSETITATLSAKAQSIGGAVDFSGAQSPPDNANGDATVDSATSVSVTVSGVNADDFVFDCVRSPGGSPSVGANQTAQWNLAAGGERGGGSTQDGVDGGVMSWTSGGAQAWALTACRVPAAAVTGPPAGLRTLGLTGAGI